MSSALFTESDYYRGPELSLDAVRAAEEQLGVELPPSYVSLLLEQNGGSLSKGCIPTTFPTSWALDHIKIEAIRGIGGKWGIESVGPLGSATMVKEWGYPPIGVVICEMPSGGHDAVMLDYTGGGVEPTVVYIDEDRVPKLLAPTFTDFLARFVSCDALGA